MKLQHFHVVLALMFLCNIVHLEKLRYRNEEHIKAPHTFKKKNYEVVFPKRIHKKLPHDQETYSMKYSYTNSTPNDEEIHLLVPFNGNQHHVALRPSRHIRGPGMIIETFKHPARSHLRSHKDHRCHFTGKVRGHRHSRAALSMCNGLAGYLQTNEGLFMIEPQHKNDDHALDVPHPHEVYQYHPHDLFCSTTSTTTSTAEPFSRHRRASATTEKTGDKTDDPNAESIVAAPPEMYIEILVVLDQSLIHHHKEMDIENYVFTVFNIAYDLFHDASLGYNINLSIVRLIRLEVEDHDLNIAATHNIEKALQYFRLWQKKINPREDTHPNHHDLAILLTRIDICSDDKTCGFMGAAQLGGMCDATNQAVIVQDNGLVMGYTLAHEIGHTLNMVHDETLGTFTDLHKVANEALYHHTVMNPSITNSMVEWSNCSRKRLQEFIDYGFGTCLYDLPTEHSFDLVHTLPGVMYDTDYQCKSILGANAGVCQAGFECDNLMCAVDNKGCIETHMRILDGTLCSENKWCFHGECVEVGERPRSVQGGWGNWSEWTDCTRTCGSGVASQMRICNNPSPKYGGKFCEGPNSRYKICTTEPCDLDQPSFRDLQCAEFNSWLYPGDGQIHRWKSYPIHAENPCALYCITENGFIASLRPRVIDGTTCYRGIRDICITGVCREIPCDLDLQSKAVEDRCGVCRGDGTSCEITGGQTAVHYIENIDSERRILHIPRGAINLRIEEMFPSETRIQVRDGPGITTYIDGNMLGMFNVHGAKAWVGMIRLRQEAISIQGPLNDNITVWVNVLANTTLKYSYAMPSTKKRSPSFSWDYLDWSACSSECGPGIQESTAKCVEKETGLVDEAYCKNITQPKEQMRPCEIMPCMPRWFVGDWGECQHCPFGVRTRIVKCYKPVGTGEGELDIISDSNCANNKPKASEFCSCKRAKRDANSSTTPSETSTTSGATTQSSISTTQLQETKTDAQGLTRTANTETSKLEDIAVTEHTASQDKETHSAPSALAITNAQISNIVQSVYEIRDINRLLLSTASIDNANNALELLAREAGISAAETAASSGDSTTAAHSESNSPTGETTAASGASTGAESNTASGESTSAGSSTAAAEGATSAAGSTAASEGATSAGSSAGAAEGSTSAGGTTAAAEGSTASGGGSNASSEGASASGGTTVSGETTSAGASDNPSGGNATASGDTNPDGHETTEVTPMTLPAHTIETTAETYASSVITTLATTIEETTVGETGGSGMINMSTILMNSSQPIQPNMFGSTPTPTYSVAATTEAEEDIFKNRSTYSTNAPPEIKPVFDFMDTHHLVLDIHRDFALSKSGNHKIFNDTNVEISDKDALKYIAAIDSDPYNNKTKP